MEFIPDPKKELWNPCEEQNRYNNTEIQRALSCMAKDNGLYLVANMGDYQPCQIETDKHCPADNHYQFNTAVVYNSTGFLIAKYHKINLFFEYMFDYPPVHDIISFETPFGKFGVMICFDILFKNPSIALVNDLQVGNIVFPTAWMDALPILSANQFHSAFAAGLDINFLAANIKLPEKRFHGSGIYGPNGTYSFYYSEDHRGKLIVADIPVIRRQTSPRLRHYTNFPVTDINNYEFHADVFHDTYNFVLVSRLSDDIRVCQGNVCCLLSYTRQNTTELFAFGAYDGLHTYEGRYYMQVCILLKCVNNSISSCGAPEKNSKTYFTKVRIQGTFQTPYIYPEILLSTGNNSLSLSDPSMWTYANSILEAKHGFENPLVSTGMISRIYSRD